MQWLLIIEELPEYHYHNFKQGTFSTPHSKKGGLLSVFPEVRGMFI